MYFTQLNCSEENFRQFFIFFQEKLDVITVKTETLDSNANGILVKKVKKNWNLAKYSWNHYRVNDRSTFLITTIADNYATLKVLWTITIVYFQLHYRASLLCLLTAFVNLTNFRPALYFIEKPEIPCFALKNNTPKK